MRRAAVVILACAVAAATPGCSAQLTREGPGATPAPPSDPTSGASSPPALPPARTDVPDEALLPAEQVVGDVGAVVAWTLPEGCTGGTPSAAAAMRTVTDGDGRFDVVRVQQVAAFPDTAAAVAEARRLAREMRRCADDDDPDGLRVAGSVPVGAQGYGLARRYDAGGTPAPFGTYAAITRRGNAVTLVAHTSGETSVEGSRRVVLADAQAAWERLCLYDRTAGCPPG